jgi:hypothetical protein
MQLYRFVNSLLCSTRFLHSLQLLNITLIERSLNVNIKMIDSR